MVAAKQGKGFEVKRISSTDDRLLEDLTRFAATHDCPSPFQSGALFKVYSMAKGCSPLGFVAEDDDGELIGSIVATRFMDAGVLVGKIVNHVSCRGGPLFLPTKAGKSAGEQLLLRLLDAAEERSLYTRVYPMFDDPVQLSLLAGAKFSRQDWLNYLLDLSIGKEMLWAKMRKTRRIGIQKASKLGLEMAEVSTAKDVDTLYGLLIESHEHVRIPLQDKSLFEAVHRLLVPQGMAKMVMAYHGEKPVAAIVALTFSGIIYDWYAGFVREEHEVNANEFLVWRLMTWGCESGCRLFDFGGAGLPEEEYGPREFKRGFRGQLVNFGRYTVVHKPKMLKLIRNLYDVRRRI